MKMGDILAKAAYIRTKDLATQSVTVLGNNINYSGYHTRNYSGTPRMYTFTSTFNGWATRLKNNNGKIIGAEIYLQIEKAPATVTCKIYNDSFQVISSVNKIIKTSERQKVIFILPEEVSISDSNFYISVETDNNNRMNRPDTTLTADSTAMAGYPNKFKTTAGAWVNMATPTDYTMAVTLFSKNDIVYIDKNHIESDYGLAIQPKVYCVVGNEMNIYFDNLVSKNDLFKFDTVCTIGVQQNERMKIVPGSAATTALTINCYDNRDTLIYQSNASIISVDSTAKSGVNETCLFIGDSTTAANVYTQELLTLFGSDVMDITLIGTKGTGLNKHEGIGGWTVDMFYQNVSSPFVFSGVFNFTQYMSTNGYVAVDKVFIHLGINDVFNATTDDEVITILDSNITKMNAMITSIKSFNANTKICIMVTIPPSSTQDSFGDDYASGVTQSRYKRNNYLYARRLIDSYNYRESENILLVPVNLNLDTARNMQTTTVEANSRNSTIITRQNNGVHPADIGYYQMADTIYYFLKNV